MRIAALVLLVLTSTVGAQESAGPSTGVARITGRVVSADTGAPLAGARVSVVPLVAGSPAIRTVRSDAAGGFDFLSVPAGNYVVRASKAGYFSWAGRAARSVGVQVQITAEPGRIVTPDDLARMLARAEALSGGGQQVSVRGGQTLDRVTVALRRGGAIMGRVVDRHGEPLPQMQVDTQRFRYGQDGTRSPVVAGVSDLTDDLGQFRVWGLPPGDYRVLVSGRNAAGPPGPTLASTSSAVVAAPASPGLFNANAEAAPTYYPGTSNPDEAQVISLGPGQEAGVHFTYEPAFPVRVSGVALLSDGRPAAGMSVRLRSSTARPFPFGGGGTVSGDGAFLIDGVVPGRYWVDVVPATRNPGAERGSTAVLVGSDDVTGVSVVTRPGVRVSGTVIFESTFEQRPTFQLSARAPDWGANEASGGAVSDPVGEDGRFEIAGLPWLVTLQPVSSQWMIKSILVDGREMVEEPLDFTGLRTVSDVQVTVTDRLPVVQGAVTDDQSRALKDRLVVLLRTDPVSGLLSDRVRTIWTDEKGSFHLRGLRSGTYLAGVVDDIEPGYEFSPDFHERLRVAGHRFTLSEGEPATLALKPTRDLP